MSDFCFVFVEGFDFENEILVLEVLNGFFIFFEFFVWFLSFCIIRC